MTQDTGPGISPENLSRLFIPFARLDAAQSGIPGTGLGLVLSQGRFQQRKEFRASDEYLPKSGYPERLEFAFPDIGAYRRGG